MKIIEQRMSTRARLPASGSTYAARVSKATLRAFNDGRAPGLIVLLVSTLATSACAQPSPAQPSTDLARIIDLIGPATCADDHQCRVIGIGRLPCGGPERYLPWSVAATEETALRDSAARYAEAQRRHYENIGVSGICVVQPEPGVRCERSAPQRCVLVPVGPGQSLVR